MAKEFGRSFQRFLAAKPGIAHLRDLVDRVRVAQAVRRIDADQTDRPGDTVISRAR